MTTYSKQYIFIDVSVTRSQNIEEISLLQVFHVKLWRWHCETTLHCIRDGFIDLAFEHFKLLAVTSQLSQPQHFRILLDWILKSVARPEIN